MKSKRRLKSWVIIAIFCIVILSIFAICIHLFLNSLESKNTLKVVDEVSGYHLYQSDSKYVKEVFGKLKKELKEEVVDEEAYAKYISTLFVAEFYSLSTALNKSDIKGVELIHSKYQEAFKIDAKNGIYQNIESNIYHNRTQELPLVSKVEVNVKQKMYTSSLLTDAKAYEVECEVTYEKELGYPSKVHLILVHEKDRLSIVSVK